MELSRSFRVRHNPGYVIPAWRRRNDGRPGDNDGMKGRSLVCTDDAGREFTIGPLFTDATEERLRRDADGYGWTVVRTVPNYSMADFTHARARGEGLVQP